MIVCNRSLEKLFFTRTEYKTLLTACLYVRYPNVVIGASPSGKATVFGTVTLGSNPSAPASSRIF